MEEDKKDVKQESNGKPGDYRMHWNHGCMHNHMAGKAIVAVIGVVIVVGAACAIVRVSEFRHDGNKRVNNIMVGRVGIDGRGMMNGGRGGMRVRESGITGKISKIDGSKLTITGNNKDLTVVIQDTTSIYDSSDNIIGKSDLKVSDQLIVMGRPNSDGQVVAQMIRVQ